MKVIDDLLQPENNHHTCYWIVTRVTWMAEDHMPMIKSISQRGNVSFTMPLRNLSQRMQCPPLPKYLNFHENSVIPVIIVLWSMSHRRIGILLRMVIGEVRAEIDDP